MPLNLHLPSSWCLWMRIIERFGIQDNFFPGKRSIMYTKEKIVPLDISYLVHVDLRISTISLYSQLRCNKIDHRSYLREEGRQ